MRRTISFIADISTHRAAEGKLAGIEQELLQMKAREKETRGEMHIERRFRELLEAAPDAIVEVDREGRIVLLNRVTEKLFGYSHDELLGQSIEILVPDSVRAIHVNHRANYWNHPVARPMGSGLSLYGRRKDGSSIPVEISLSPVKSEDGFRVTAIIRDIRQRKQNEDQIREMQQQAYTRELELRNREVERANQLKSEFLASMSHELRTPLHTIIGFAELLAEEIEGPLNEKQKRFLDHIHTDSLHLLELINDVLDLSKVESGRLELRCETFDVASAVEETLSSILPQGIAKSIDIKADVPPATGIFADRVRFKQILFNLLSNAVKFTPEGGRISVEATLRNDCLEMSVSDTGIGIPTAQQEAVFDKFYQVGATTKGVREGTGLGLAITKSLVEKHGGRIWLESEPGKGSRFTFTIALEQPR
ncbi:MAG TPA: PAS domain-containing sensor histidine kinase [Bryobacteraceae bacterium]|nr:PAS domain-containing sensor histidine kinase [Bryobacteraceae bacterium]